MVSRAEWARRPRRESFAKRRRKLAERIAARDGHACVYCGSRRNLHVDHLRPRRLGGGDHPRNLVLACGRCNTRRRDMPLERWALEATARPRWRKMFTAASIRWQACKRLPKV